MKTKIDSNQNREIKLIKRKKQEFYTREFYLIYLPRSLKPKSSEKSSRFGYLRSMYSGKHIDKNCSSFLDSDTNT